MASKRERAVRSAAASERGMARVSSERGSQLSTLFKTVLGTRLAAYDPWLYHYCGGVAEPKQARKYLQYLVDLLDFGGVEARGNRLLDAGCGFGFALIASSLLGVAEAHGIDIYRPMLETVRAYLPILPGDVSARIRVTEGDASAMPFEDASFDIVISNEAISHYRDVDSFLDESARILRRGGVLVIFDGNNGLNPSIRRKTREIWRAFELGTDQEWVHTHKVEKCYQRRRAEIVAERFPQASPEEIKLLSSRTFAMTVPDVVHAAERYFREGVAPTSLFTGEDVPVDPDIGLVIERLFDPYELARQLEQRGFETRVGGYWGGASGRRWVRLVNTVLTAATWFTLRTATSFRIAATKR